MRTGKLFDCEMGCINHNNSKRQDERGLLSNKNLDDTRLCRPAGFHGNLPRARGETKSLPRPILGDGGPFGLRSAFRLGLHCH
ncbi:MAG: hypothetical protein ACP5R4_01630 [Armatimonadota bacterium]